jgi:hypothetical protein
MGVGTELSPNSHPARTKSSPNTHRGRTELAPRSTTFGAKIEITGCPRMIRGRAALVSVLLTCDYLIGAVTVPEWSQL